MTEEEIKKTMKSLGLAHSMTHNSIRIPAVVSAISEIETLTLRGLATSWRPIEEAVKDGSHYLLGHQGAWLGEGYWGSVRGNYGWKHLHPDDERQDYWMDSPTHFIPISALELKP